MGLESAELLADITRNVDHRGYFFVWGTEVLGKVLWPADAKLVEALAHLGEKRTRERHVVELFRYACHFGGRHSGSVGLDVVRVAVAAICVVGDDHLWPVASHQRRQLPYRLLQGHIAERTWVSVRVPPRHT